jgi:hypothetical protein
MLSTRWWISSTAYMRTMRLPGTPVNVAGSDGRCAVRSHCSEGPISLRPLEAAALPAAGEPLGGFAARIASGAHALDTGEPLATLALGAARALAGLDGPGPDESPTEERREAWAAVGLLCDELSSIVLTLGLPGDEVKGSGRILNVARESGQPGAATMLLLRALAAVGARLIHHGDFDWGGIRIGNLLHRRLALEPWQFDADAYIRAAGAVTSCQPLVGGPVQASWDPRLSETMRHVGRRIEEELVLEGLLADLAG